VCDYLRDNRLSGIMHEPVRHFLPLLLILGFNSASASRAEAQGRVGVGAGAFLSAAEDGAPTGAANALVAVQLKSDRYLELQGQWWNELPHVWGLGLYAGGRPATRRWMYFDLGFGTTAREGEAGKLRFRPALGLDVGVTFDLGTHLQMRAGANLVRDSRATHGGIGLTVCVGSASK
jgi:hypothetical protein